MWTDWKARLAKHAPAEPIDGAVSVKMTILYGPPEVREQFEHRTPKPDADNVEKTVYDVMATIGFFTNDAHVATSLTTKAWGEPQGIYARIERIEAAS